MRPVFVSLPSVPGVLRLLTRELQVEHVLRE